jgi:hypothetical protein
MTEDFEADRRTIALIRHWPTKVGNIECQHEGGIWGWSRVAAVRWPAALDHITDAHALLTELRFYVGPPMQAKIDKLLGSAGTEGSDGT